MGLGCSDNLLGKNLNMHIYFIVMKKAHIFHAFMSLYLLFFFSPGFTEVCLRLTFCFELRVNEICNDYGFWHLHHAWTPVCIDNFCKYRIFFFFLRSRF